MQQRTKNKLWKMWKHAAKTQGNNGKYEKKMQQRLKEIMENVKKMHQRLKEIMENVKKCSNDSRKLWNM